MTLTLSRGPWESNFIEIFPYPLYVCWEPLCEPNFYAFLYLLRVASGPGVELVDCQSIFNPPVVYSTDRSKAVVPMLVLLFVVLWFVLSLALFYFILVFFSPISIAITSLGEETKNSAFRIRCSICACLVLSVFSSSWCLGRTAARNSGTPWGFLSPFFYIKTYEGESISNQLNLFPVKIHLFYFDVIAL